MLKLISRTFITLGILLYFSILFILPFQWYKIGPYSEIFPAFDLIIIYYLSTYSNIKYWHLFLIGLIIDQLCNLPVGINSMLFILSYKVLKISSQWFILKNYKTNIIIFTMYSFIIALSRYLTVTVKSTYHIEGSSIIFYYLTTIFSYPAMYFAIQKPIEKLNKYEK